VIRKLNALQLPGRIEAIAIFGEEARVQVIAAATVYGVHAGAVNPSMGLHSISGSAAAAPSDASCRKCRREENHRNQ